MKGDTMNFFDPTSRYKEMALLEHIEKYEQTTQKEMSNKIEASLSMVNTYLDKLESNNLIVREYKSTKVVHYHITPEGIKRKNYLQITYIKELMNLYIKGQDSVSHFLQTIKDKGFKKILLYGAGEVAEIILDIINSQNINIEVIGLIDDNTSKQGQTIKGIKIYDNSCINELDHDGLVITSYTFEEEIINKLTELHYQKNKIIRYFDIKER